MTKKKEKKLVFEIKLQMQLLENRIEKGRRIVQAIVDQAVEEFPFLDLNDIPSIKELINNPRQTVLKALESQAVETDPESGFSFLKTSLYGMQIDVEKAISLLKAPITDFINKINSLDKEDVLDFLNVAKWDESDPANGAPLVVDEELLDKLKDRYRTYANTPRKIDFLEAYERYIAAANDLVKLGVPINHFMNHPGRFFYSKSKDKLEISPKFFTSFC